MKSLLLQKFFLIFSFTAICISNSSYAAQYQVKSKSRTLNSGIELTQHLVSGEDDSSVSISLTIVKVNTRVNTLSLCQVKSLEEWKTSKEWADTNCLNVAMCASMHHSNGDSVGYLVCQGKLESKKVVENYGAFLAFGPKNSEDIPVAIFDKTEKTFSVESIAQRYNTIIQGMFMVKNGKAVPWNKKKHSASAYAMSWDGDFLFIHSKKALPIQMLNEVLSLDTFHIQSAIYADGGSEAALCVDDQVEVGEFTPRNWGCCSETLNFLASTALQCFYPYGKKVPRVIGVKATITEESKTKDKIE